MPSKNIVDFANQIKGYLQSAEVVPTKNLLDNAATTQTLNTVEFNVNGDNSVSLGNNTASANTFFYSDNYTTLPAGTYVLSGCPADGDYFNSYGLRLVKNDDTEVATDNGSSVQFTLSETTSVRYVIRIKSGQSTVGLIFKPMVCTLDEWNKSHTYESYYVPVKDSKLDIADQQVLGAWNQLENKATTQTINPVTFTVNTNKSVSLSGTTGASDYKSLNLTDEMYLEAGKPYYLSGCPVDGGHSGAWRYTLQVVHTNNVEPTYLYGHGVDSGNGSGAFAVAVSGYYRVRINTYPNQTYNGQTFYPMIALKPNQPYVPYAMTNRELTDKLAVTESAFTDIISGASVTDNMNYLTKTGNVVSAWLILGSVTVASWTKIAGIPDGYRPKHDMFFRDSQSNRQFKISSVGNLSCADSLSSASFAICVSWITL